MSKQVQEQEQVQVQEIAEDVCMGVSVRVTSADFRWTDQRTGEMLHKVTQFVDVVSVDMDVNGVSRAVPSRTTMRVKLALKGLTFGAAASGAEIVAAVEERLAERGVDAIVDISGFFVRQDERLVDGTVRYGTATRRP